MRDVCSCDGDNNGGGDDSGDSSDGLMLLAHLW